MPASKGGIRRLGTGELKLGYSLGKDWPIVRGLLIRCGAGHVRDNYNIVGGGVGVAPGELH